MESWSGMAQQLIMPSSSLDFESNRFAQESDPSVPVTAADDKDRDYITELIKALVDSNTVVCNTDGVMYEVHSFIVAINLTFIIVGLYKHCHYQFSRKTQLNKLSLRPLLFAMFNLSFVSVRAIILETADS